ncbi:secretion protein domain-containing protein [Desulfonema limicola]|uniref:Secretion protein domain-containing protein n=1 Tax=Desulfonema limicola TaxID=45656 RepID=A0A975GGT0_9BACT|nr:HlyD family efflux transporter periplasmic adaptor subunit [Desulfonema limicola]QTA80594.1 secretion protein domain-containing protein [Desulfonema limicola]
MPLEDSSEKLGQIFADHDAHGVDILMGRSSFMSQVVIYIFVGILLSALIWSFFGKTDLIVKVEGRLEPRLDIRHVYPPIGGELTDIYAVEGAFVSRGDLLARLRATDAIQAATDAEKARINLEQAKFDYKLFPRKKELLEKELENITGQIKQKEKEYKLFKQDQFRNLPAIHKHKLEKSRLKIEQAEKEMYAARDMMEKYQRLGQAENGGVSQKEIEEKHENWLREETKYKDLLIDLNNLEYEFSQQETQFGKRVSDTLSEILNLRFQQESKKLQIENEEIQVNIQYRAALAAFEAASVITFDDLDKDNFMKIRSPVSGEVTFVAFTQRGEKIKPDVPLVSIAPAGSEKVLMISIPDKDRGLLKPGQTVKLKFAAFPYHRYGFITGTLEYISPDAAQPKDDKSYYRGRVSMDKDFYTENGKNIIIKYGMTAIAEIAVKKLRIIDIFLDPFKKFSGKSEI